MNVVILGATSGMGRALARRMAARGDRLVLLGRDPTGLERSAADLQARSPGSCLGTARCDLLEPDTFAPALDSARESLGDVECIVITAAHFGTQEELESDLERTARLLRVNFSHTVLLCEHAKAMLLARGGGRLCVFSSVAGERARKPTVLYGASKAGLSYYLEGLDHKHRADGLLTTCVKPGFVHTGMTADLPAPPFAGRPEQVAALVLRALDRGDPVVYAPRIWSLVMLTIRLLPRAAMRRLGF